MTLDGMKYIARMSGCVVFGYSEAETILVAFGLYDESKEADGILLDDSAHGRLIFIDDSMPEEKQMFAIAHELGHLILKHEQGLPFDMEKEADEFAKTMLLTTRALNKGVVL